MNIVFVLQSFVYLFLKQAQHRYAAKLAGFYPTDNVEALVCDEVMDTLNEMMSNFPWQAKDDEEKKKLREEFQNGTMTKTMKFIEQCVQDAGGKGVVKSGPCVADLMLMTNVKSIRSGMLDYLNTDFFASYPGITAAAEGMMEHAKVKAYYDSLN